MPDIILHHYAPSPYSQKVRSFLGYKNLAWRSHVVPPVPPRPEVNLLTGGNRRIPVLQIGADIICDSNMILRTLERLYPAPPLSPAADALIHPISHLWEPRQMIYMAPIRFMSREDAAGMFASEADMVAFRTDRIPFMAPAVDITKNAEFAPSAAAHVKLHADWLDTASFIGRPVPGRRDAVACRLFCVPWLLVVEARLGDKGLVDAARWPLGLGRPDAGPRPGRRKHRYFRSDEVPDAGSLRPAGNRAHRTFPCPSIRRRPAASASRPTTMDATRLSGLLSQSALTTS